MLLKCSWSPHVFLSWSIYKDCSWLVLQGNIWEIYCFKITICCLRCLSEGHTSLSVYQPLCFPLWPAREDTHEVIRVSGTSFHPIKCLPLLNYCHPPSRLSVSTKDLDQRKYISTALSKQINLPSKKGRVNTLGWYMKLERVPYLLMKKVKYLNIHWSSSACPRSPSSSLHTHKYEPVSSILLPCSQTSRYSAALGL